MTTTSNSLPTTAASTLTGTSVNVWVNPDNAKTVGGGSATCVFLNPDENSDYLVLTNFNFAIPAGATIDGIVVQVLGTDDFVFDGSPLNQGVVAISLYNSTTLGFAKSSNLDGVLNTVGSVTNKWNATLTAGLCNLTTFGVAISVFSGGFDIFPCTATIDYVKMQITYTLASGRTQLLSNQSGYWGSRNLWSA